MKNKPDSSPPVPRNWRRLIAEKFGLSYCDKTCPCGKNSQLWWRDNGRTPDTTPDWMNGADTDAIWEYMVKNGIATARQGKLTATPAVHAAVPVATVMEEDDEAMRLRAERDAACLRLARQELTISMLRLALAMVVRVATVDAGDLRPRGERLDEVRKIARGALG